MGRDVLFYKTERGGCPVEDFLDALPSKAAQKVLWVLKLVKELDIVPIGYFKKLTGTEGIWECRIVHQGNTYRVLGFYDQPNRVVLTHGFMKKTPKTPRTEIERATQLRADHLRRRPDA
jgi:phage-related protein